MFPDTFLATCDEEIDIALLRPPADAGAPRGRARLKSPERRGVGAEDLSGARAVSGRRGPVAAPDVFM